MGCGCSEEEAKNGLEIFSDEKEDEETGKRQIYQTTEERVGALQETFSVAIGEDSVQNKNPSVELNEAEHNDEGEEKKQIQPMKVQFYFRAKNQIVPTVSDDALPEQKIPAKPEKFESTPHEQDFHSMDVDYSQAKNQETIVIGDALPEQKIPAKPEQFEYPKSKPDENNKQVMEKLEIARNFMKEQITKLKQEASKLTAQIRTVLDDGEYILDQVNPTIIQIFALRIQNQRLIEMQNQAKSLDNVIKSFSDTQRDTMGVLFKLLENYEDMCASMIGKEGQLVLTRFREDGNVWLECMMNLVQGYSEQDSPLFNPPEKNEDQLVKDFIFLIRCRFDSDYGMDVITDDPYQNFKIEEFESKDQALNHLWQLRCDTMWSSFKAQNYDQFVDLEDPEYKEIQVRTFYRHHPKNGYLIEVDARAVGSNFNFGDSQWAFSRMEDEADRLNLYYRKIILIDESDVLWDHTHMFGHSVIERETRFCQQTHSGSFEDQVMNGGVRGRPRLILYQMWNQKGPRKPHRTQQS